MKLLLLLLLLFFASADGRANVDDNFHGIDFKNHVYPYRFSWGKHKQINVRLTNGRYEYDFRDERGWFDFSHVYTADVAGDRRPEAIIMLWHVACGVSCDGGSALFYIYSFDNHRLTPVWQHETGSLADGCGLKSFTANHRTLTLELFGRCSQGKRINSSTGKSRIKDLTSVTLKTNGSRFVVRKRQFFSVPERSVQNYEPEIHISK